MRLHAVILAASLVASPIAMLSAQNYYPSLRDDKSAAGTVVLSKFTAAELIGKTVYDTQDKNIGEISDIILQPKENIKHVVLDVGGFLGMGERAVAIETSSLSSDANGNIRVTMTKEALQALPPFKKSERGWYQVGTDTAPSATTTAADELPKSWGSYSSMTDKSMKLTITGTVSASDLVGQTIYDVNEKNVGEISDLLVEPDNTVRRVIIDVGGFLGVGEKPVAVRLDQLRIDKDKYVYVDVSKETLESMPTYVRNDERWSVRG